MEDKSSDVLNYPLSIIRKLGLYSETNPMKVILIATLYITICGFLDIVTMMQFPYLTGDLFEFVSSVEAFGVYGQIIGKIAFIGYQHKKVIALIKDTKYFWSTDICTDKLEFELNSTFDKMLKMQKVFCRIVIVAVLGMCVPLLFGRPFILGIWNTVEYESLYKAALTSQLLTMLLLMFFISGFDCLYLAFCTHVIVQFKILSHCFKELSVLDVSSRTVTEKYYYNLKVYIQQHCFLLRFTRCFQKTYSPVMLCQCVTVIMLICTSMYVLLEVGDIRLLLRCGGTFFCQLVQLALYCIPAELVTAEMLAISDGVFDSDWCSEFSSKLRSPLILIIQRSQREHSFTAGGLFEIRTGTLVAVLRTSWAVCTLFRALK